MALKNTDHSYGWLAKLFHWVMALLIIAMIVMGFNLDELKIWDIHKSFGLLILMLVGLRILWALKNPKPSLPEGMSNLVKKSATGMHYILYLTMIALPISGIIMSVAGGRDVPFFGLFSISKLAEKDKALSGIGHEAHEYLAFFICAFITLHILGALYHHFKLRDNTLVRMLPFVGRGSAGKE